MDYGMVSCGSSKRFPISLHRTFYTSQQPSKTSETLIHYNYVLSDTPVNFYFETNSYRIR